MKTYRAGAKKGKAEACFCFKQALGETFFHGLNLLNSLESENSRLQQSLNNAKSSSEYYKSMLDDAEKKLKDLKEDHKSKLKKIQDELDKSKADDKLAGKAHAKELERLQ